MRLLMTKKHIRRLIIGSGVSFILTVSIALIDGLFNYGEPFIGTFNHWFILQSVALIPVAYLFGTVLELFWNNVLVQWGFY